jgi:hypothetical protein
MTAGSDLISELRSRARRTWRGYAGQSIVDAVEKVPFAWAYADGIGDACRFAIVRRCFSASIMRSTASTVRESSDHEATFRLVFDAYWLALRHQSGAGASGGASALGSLTAPTAFAVV